jgi:hypothetical protein
MQLEIGTGKNAGQLFVGKSSHEKNISGYHSSLQFNSPTQVELI